MSASIRAACLTDGVDQNPHCVLLLDEIEKAHPDLFNVLLQVMDHGKLTDHNGKQVDFRNVILIMTTNAGAAEMAKVAIGFGGTQRTGEDEEAIKRMFTPEFRNRLDAVIAFSRLSRAMISKVVEKFVFQLEAQLADRNVMIELSPEAMEWIADHGYDELYGARPLARVIQEHVKKPLAEELLFGKLEGGGTVRVIVAEKDGVKALSFEVIEIKPLVKAEERRRRRGGRRQRSHAVSAHPEGTPEPVIACNPAFGVGGNGPPPELALRPTPPRRSCKCAAAGGLSDREMRWQIEKIRYTLEEWSRFRVKVHGKPGRDYDVFSSRFRISHCITVLAMLSAQSPDFFHERIDTIAAQVHIAGYS